MAIQTTKPKVLNGELIQARIVDFVNLEDKLPNKPSALLRAALKDFQTARSTPNVQINMDHWWMPIEDDVDTAILRQTNKFHENVCQLCFAGSTLLGTYGLKPYDDVHLFKGLGQTVNTSTSTLVQKFGYLDSVRIHESKRQFQFIANWTRLLKDAGNEEQSLSWFIEVDEIEFEKGWKEVRKLVEVAYFDAHDYGNSFDSYIEHLADVMEERSF